jgi:hypothetical protein
VRTITRDELLMFVNPEVGVVLGEWLDDGRSVACYQNHDMGHSEIGHRKFMSYGTSDSTFRDPPDILPDTDEINWRYVLTEVCPSKEEKKS